MMLVSVAHQFFHMSENRLERGKRGVVVHQRVDQVKVTLARSFRRRPTKSEAAVWALLRHRGVLGMKFRRQQVIDGFIVDFYCAEYRLILEIDGAVHMDPIRNEQDSERTAHLTAGGFKVIRLPNRNVSREALVRLLHPFPTRAPSPGRERGTGGEV